MSRFLFFEEQKKLTETALKAPRVPRGLHCHGDSARRGDSLTTDPHFSAL